MPKKRKEQPTSRPRRLPRNFIVYSRLRPADYARLVEIAETEGVTISYVLFRAFAQWAKTWERPSNDDLMSQL